MEYSKGTCGRSFVVRFDHDEDFLESLKSLAKKENITTAWFWCLGAVKQTDIVTGPEKTEIPPVPMWHTIKEAHEVIAVGNISIMDGEPALHIHVGLGRGKETSFGCARKNSITYLTIECFIQEISDISFVRMKNDKLKINTLSFDK